MSSRGALSPQRPANGLRRLRYLYFAAMSKTEPTAAIPAAAPTAAATEIRRLHARVDQLLLKDRERFKRRLKSAAPAQLPALAGDLAIAETRAHAFSALKPAIRLDESLPISARAAEITEAIRRHPVLIVAGETGSGKTTQLPKLCLSAGRGRYGVIGVTQPRRLAARSIAARVASELASPLGELVGFQVRFQDSTAPNTRIKFMTDGILLKETQTDRALLGYDTLIIDEAHERSLNIDFLIGYLRQLIDRRRDLKLIITSATIDTARFSRHFADAPVIEVSGRSYPVELRYRPLEYAQAEAEPQTSKRRSAGPSTPTRSSEEGIAAALEELWRDDPRGDALVFLPGEREIRDTAEHLRLRKYAHTEILPLYARLSVNEQQRIFSPGSQRRVVLATNVAETSITVPRIRFVVDPGTARLSRYLWRSKVQRLQVEKISQASANQRAGRCGRLSAGICVRLYAEDDFIQRPAFTDPEIVRTSLAQVILQMKALKLGDPARFPFLDAPDPRQLRDGFELLDELDALDAKSELTATGMALSRLPLDVKLGRMLIEAKRLDCVAEVLIIATGLSIQDPRERPLEARQYADLAHAEFIHPDSDFLSLFNLWTFYANRAEDLTQSGLRRLCAEKFLNYVRMREWRELHRQLLLQLREDGWTLNSAPARYEQIHQALLSGLLGNVGWLQEKRDYLGARLKRFAIFPGSALSKKKPPPWIMAGALLDTQKLYGLTLAKIEPEWIEPLAKRLLKRRVFDPSWSRAQGRVMAYEQLTLYGLVVVAKRPTVFDEPIEARQIFIEAALVGGALDWRHPLLKANQDLIENVREQERRERQAGLIKTDRELAHFFDARLPPEIASVKALREWFASGQGEVLRLGLRDVLMVDESAMARAQAYPDEMKMGLVSYPLSYVFEPKSEVDGVSLQVPLHLLNGINPARLEWLVPGLLAAKLDALLRALPKALRRNVVPVPEYVRALMESLVPNDAPLLPAVCLELKRMTGVEFSPSDFAQAELAPHLQLRIALIDASGAVLNSGRDLSALQAQYGSQAREAFAQQAGANWDLTGLQEWSFAELPAHVALPGGALGYPALVDETQTIGVKVFETQAQAQESHRLGLIRLLRIQLEKRHKGLKKNLPINAQLSLRYATIDAVDNLREDVLDLALSELLREEQTPVRDRVHFAQLLERLSVRVGEKALELCAWIEQILAELKTIHEALSAQRMGYGAASYDDIREQINALVYRRFLRHTPYARIAHIVRYLKAVVKRMERLKNSAPADQAKLLEIKPYLDALTRMQQSRHPRTEELRWLLEEFRISLFAQEIKTAEPVSAKRLMRLVASG